MTSNQLYSTVVTKWRDWVFIRGKGVDFRAGFKLTLFKSSSSLDRVMALCTLFLWTFHFFYCGRLHVAQVRVLRVSSDPVALHVIIGWVENRRNNICIYTVYEINIIVCNVIWHGSMKKIVKLCHVKVDAGPTKYTHRSPYIRIKHCLCSLV